MSRRIRYRKAGAAVFDAPVEKVFEYMSADGHPHAVFKNHRLVGIVGNVVTLEADIYNPDGSTSHALITHRLNRPDSIETTMAGGVFDGALFVHRYTPIGGRTLVDLESEFPIMPGMTESNALAMIERFFALIFGEDEATLRTWKGA